MDTNWVQPPRYTSTPRAGRNMVSLLNNLIEVSPIFPAPDNLRKAKSMIPVVTTKGMRSNGVQSVGAKTKVSMSTNSTGQGSSGSVKIPPHIPKAAAAEKKSKIDNVQVQPNSASHVLPEISKGASQNAPPNSDNKVSTKKASQTKHQVPEAASARNSVDEDDSRLMTRRVSKMSQRPSTLPCVPERALIGGTAQMSEDCIFKTSVKTQSGWLIPKETKKQVSLKRKSSVPSTVTKRNKTAVANFEANDKSLFDSPELPNLVEVLSLCNRRQTYVVKNIPEITDTEEEYHKSVTDGIIPLQTLSQESPLSNTSVKSMQGDFKKQTQETETRNNIKMSAQTAPKNNLDEINKVEENVEQGNYVSPNAKVYKNKNKRNPTKQPNSQLKNNHNIESLNSKTESVVNSAVEETKSTESNQEIVQKEIESDISEKRFKELNVNNHHSTEIIQDLNTKSPIRKTVRKRILRERKPNIKYVDKSEISCNNSKEVPNKNKEEPTVKISLEDKENLNDPPVKKNKLPRKNTVKRNKKQSCINSIPDELPLNCQNEGLEEVTDGGISSHHNKSKNPKLKKTTEKEDDTTSAPKQTKNLVKSLDHRETENPKKTNKVIKESSQIPAEEKEENITRAHKPDKIDTRQNEPLAGITPKSSTSKQNVNRKKTRLEKQTSPAQNKTYHANGGNEGSHKAGDLKYEENLKSALNVSSSSNPANNNKIGGDISPESKNHLDNAKVKHANEENPLMKPAEQGIDGNRQSTRGGKSKKFVEGKTTNKKGSDISPGTKRIRKTVLDNDKVKYATENNLSMKTVEQGIDGNGQSTRGAKSKKFVEEKEKTEKTVRNKPYSKSQSRVKAKNSDVCEHSSQKEEYRNTLNKCNPAEESNKLSEDGSCPETETCMPSTRKKRKSEGSHSGPESASKRLRCDVNVNNGETQFNINDLFGMSESKTIELQPGVVAYKFIHIHNFVMTGEVCLDPGATLSKISTNTTYCVIEGTAQVRIQKHTKTFNGNDKQRRFFIPQGIDVSITNVGNLPLKMEFSKFRG